jgi:ribonuclease D
VSLKVEHGRLLALIDGARDAGRIAIDTEFMGEGRYRTLLCLIQLAVGDGDGHRHIEIVDPLAEDLDGAPLAEVLADPAIEIVLHAGRQDIALVRRRLGTEVSNILDTQIDSLLSELLGVRLSKSASFTRWDVRPLSDEQVAYAREDVVHLLDLATELERRLAARGRLEWAREECRSLQVASDERDVDAIFARLPRVRGLRPESQAIARELVEWREQTAAGQDRPVQTVLNDAGLIEVAKRRPGSIRELSQIRGVNQGSLRRLGDSLLTAVERGRSRELPASDEDRRPPTPDGDDAPLIALCESLVRARARAEGLAYELVAARADLQAIITAWRAGAAEPAVRTLHGWRRELVGEELLALLDGRISLSVDSRRRLRIASG